MSAAAPARFDPSEPLGPGRTVIEASAGTGKTFTITAAVTRLVAEEGLALEEILVVTFTRAATAELKDRVRKRMVETLRALEGRPAGPVDDHMDEHMRVLLDADEEELRRRADRLGQALNSFDRAQIFTIHGFAMRLLRKLGFRSRLPSGAAPGDIDEMLIRRAAGDLALARFADPEGTEKEEEGAAAPIDPIPPKDLAGIGKKLADTPDARILPDPAAVEGGMRIRAELALEMKELAARRMRAARTVTYDDTLVEARDALADPAVGEGAKELLRRRYKAAMVDESQDTDPIQWQVIRAVFDESRLVVIGDPKQAIYSFRGADVESYLSAASGAHARRTLDTNWRSDGPLIEALDSLLAGASFGDPRISYINVSPAEQHRRPRIEGAGAPLQIRRFADEYQGLRSYTWSGRKHFYVGEVRRAAAADAAAEIVHLLTGGVTLEGEDGRRPLAPGDIAVLCRTRRQVDMVREELAARGVPSVAARTGGVFASPAAEQWRRFLYGVERPNRIDYVRMAAVTPLAGAALDEAAALRDEDALAWQQRFIGWRALLYGRGVPALLGDVDRNTGLAARVLADPGGERMLTDLFHIAEEMHTAWRRGRLGSLLVWLEAAMDEAARNADANVEDPESRQRRLETDAAAVRVQTIHAAKGLEYPVVLAPYLWDVPTRKPDIPVFHDPRPALPGEPRPRLVDVGGPDLEAHQEAAMDEQADEESRLLYVALTRAKHHLVIWMVDQVRGAEETKLGQLIGGPGEPRLSLKAGRSVVQTVMSGPGPPLRYEAGGAGLPPLDLARLERRLDYRWQRVSFSSLSPGRPLAGRADTAEQADRVDETDETDEAEEAAARADGAGPPPEAGGELPMGGLPRGARFGSLVHELFDRVPFDAPDLPAAVRAELDRLTRRAAWDFDAGLLVDGITAAMDTPLGPDAGAPTLRGLDPARTLKEMSFELPLRPGAGAQALTLADIAEAALGHLPGDDPHRPYFALLADPDQPDVDRRPFRGFMTGAIDLTALLPGPGGPRYTVIDFKSNTLPALGGAPAPADYGPRPLAAAMNHGNYPLQALLYQAALHRYLQWRLPGYRPEEHLGGSMYLFVRGMVGPGTPVVEGGRCGVARWSPPPQMIAAVSGLFAGGGEVGVGRSGG